VCLPVRNGQKYLRQCVDSILAQTLADFELIICDNASTDSTESICREYVATDARVRYFRHSEDIGPGENYNFGLDRARGQYLHWQAHDDVLLPEFLEKCVEVLERDAFVVMAYPLTRVIDEQGRTVEDYNFIIDTDHPSAATRFRRFILARNRHHRNYEIFGVYRTEVLRRGPRHEVYAHADRVLVSRITLFGRMRLLPERLFLARAHATQSMQMLPSHVSRGRSKLSSMLGPGPLPPPEWWEPRLKERIVFPDCNLLRQHWRSARVVAAAAGLGSAQRVGCYAAVLAWLGYFWPKLVRDLLFAAEALFRRLLGRIEKSRTADDSTTTPTSTTSTTGPP
jgi:glycosyltransferase involved in cell wall biosynthesis